MFDVNNINPTGMYFRTMLVTPEMAEKWLATDDRNRAPSKRKIQMAEYDLRTGNFVLTHQAIAFDVNGNLFDGQHRLIAIRNTGIPAPLSVAFNAPRNPKIDIGTKRTAKQSNYMAGLIDKGSVEYDTLTYPLITFMVSQSINPERSCLLTSDNYHRLYMKYRDVIDVVVGIVRKSSGNCRSAAVLYSMACAYADGVKEETVHEWHRIVATGDFYVEGDDKKTKAGKSVLKFRDYIRESISTRDADEETKLQIVKKAMSSICHYAKMEPIKQLRGELSYKKIQITESDMLQEVG